MQPATRARSYWNWSSRHSARSIQLFRLRPKGRRHLAARARPSRLLVTHPELVHPVSAAVRSSCAPEQMRKNSGTGAHKNGRSNLLRDAQLYGPYALWAHRDPRLAKVETGEKGYDVIVDWLTQVIKRDFFDFNERYGRRTSK